jgi:hypothetical protein
MKKVVIQFNNKQEKTFIVVSEEVPKCGHLSYCLLLKYKNLGPSQLLLEEDNYFKRYAKVSAISFFGATILECEKIDGRTKEAKNLPYFTIEECLANFQ